MAVGAAVIGRVAVKVLPDTREFRGDLYKSLRRIEQRAEVRVKAVLAPTSTLEREVLEKIREINAMNRARDSRHIKLHVDTDFSDVERKIKDVTTKATKTNKVNIKTEINAEDIEDEIRRISRDATRIKTSIDVDFDVSREKLRDLKDDIEDSLDNIRADIEPEVNEASYRHTQARLAVLARSRIVSLIPVVNRAAALAAGNALARLSGARLLGTYLRDLWRYFRDIDKHLPKIGLIANGISLISGWALTAASNIFALTGSIAQMAQASLALPGILGGFAFGIGATIAVFKDFNDVFPDFQGKLSALQDQMSEKFWSKAKEPIQELIDVLFPQFERGLIRTSDALATFFGALSTGLATRLDGHIDYMFDNLNESIEIASKGMDSLAQSMTVLGKLGSDYLPRLADWFVRINDSFAKWLTAAQDDGRLKEWVDTGIEQIGHFGRALRNAGRILRNLFQISEAAGGSTLSMFADTLGKIAEVTGREPFKSKMTQVLRSAHAMMSSIARDSGPALSRFFTTFADTVANVFAITGDTVGRVLGGIADALAHPAFQSGLVMLFEGLSAGLKALIPALEPVARGLGGVGQVLGALARNLGPVIGTAFAAIGRAVERLAPALTPIIDMLGGALVEALEILAPLLELAADTFAGLVKSTVLPALAQLLPPVVEIIRAMATHFEKLLPVVAELAEGLLPPLAEALGQILTAIQPLIPVFSELVLAVLTPLIPVLVQVAQDLFPQLAQAIITLVPVVTQLLTVLTSVLTTIMPILTPIIGFIVNFLGDTLVGLVEGAAQAIGGVLDVIVGIFDVFAGIFTMDMDRFLSGLKKIFTGAWDAIVGALKFALNFGILKVAKVALLGFKSLWTGAWGAISSFFKGAWNGINSFFNGAIGALRSAASGGINFVKNALSTGAQAARKLVIQAFQRMRDGAVNLFNNLRARVASVKDRIVGVFRNVGSWLYNSGKSLIQGFINGIWSMFDKAKNAAGSLLSGIRNLFPFSPAKEGPFSGKGWVLYSGQAIAEDLAEGMRQRVKLAKQAAEVLAEAAYPDIREPKLPSDFGEGGPDDVWTDGRLLIQQTINNPLPEEPSEATNKGLQAAAALGLV